MKQKALSLAIAAGLSVALVGCSAIRRVKQFTFSTPDPECERVEMCRRFGFCGPNATMNQVGDQTCALSDWKLGSKTEMVCFGFDSNPFNCPNARKPK